MTDNEIIKALECCETPKVGVECPRARFVDVCNDGCVHILMEQALDLINRQKLEIERLMPYGTQVEVSAKIEKEIKSEAIKEFAERLKAEYIFWKLEDGSLRKIIPIYAIDYLIKEMVGDNE